MRAGVLEMGTVALLVREDRRPDAPRAPSPDGIEICFEGERHRIDFADLTGGKTVTIYGQTEVTRDLMEALEEDGVPPRYEAEVVAIRDVEGNRPVVAYSEDGRLREITCEFVAGCDGFHGDQPRRAWSRSSPATSGSILSDGWACFRKRLRCRAK